ncbi:MAG: PQQ-dependent oxidoreductase, gdhB family [uncultured Thiotrichaceae bacterium]|uniref:PQQ-dependent oxidoreductase, gdhB family n=1 Tax=uncultured Thiotrichaceae bacterium TaxID=298394 RepID=A0A6S6T0M1_9GAMM|nr:MAG: PQQ-dependent oxidoreductase, gdhB family [uncultured Thiotrichaceae bacterium]
MTKLRFQLPRWLLHLLLGGLAFLPLAAAVADMIDTEKAKVRSTTLIENLDHPWSLAFLPDGKMLITERSGDLLIFDKEAKNRQLVRGLPDIEAYGQGGLLDVRPHPDFATNQWVYFSYAAEGENGVGTEVARGKLQGAQLSNLEVLFKLGPKSNRGQHFGSRLIFDKKGYLYITLGDRGEKNRAQDTQDHAGSVIRLHDDGRIPADNPFVVNKQGKPEIFSYGHRNIQGADLHPKTGELWSHEHGPQGGDELNISRNGQNFGWPVITYGVNYVIGTKIGEGTHKAGMQQPLHYWVPSIAPSGMSFYTGDAFPQWKNNVFVGSLKFRLLVRLELEGEKVTHEERLFKGKFGRIRDVRTGPDGFLYLLTDADNGKLIRLSPN